MLNDTHMHCCFSGDSEANPEDMIEAAIQKGLDGLCFTDHFDYDYPDDPELFLLDFSSYKKKIFSLKEKYKDKCNIRWGIEIGLQPHIVQVNNDVTAKYPFDFVIGSSHVVHGIDPYYPHYYDGRSEDEAYREYFESILENLHTNVDFDVYGHIDYIFRYGPVNAPSDAFQKVNSELFETKYFSRFKDILHEILKTIILKGKGIEINTGSLYRDLDYMHPHPLILSMYKELRGEILTIGSDAHDLEHIGYGFDEAAELARSFGFKYLTTFKEMKPEWHTL